MKYRTLGSTGLRVSAVAFGAGPVSQLLVGGQREQQRATIARALELGINWFDTAATYGNGASETNLGAVLRELQASKHVMLASKVRIMPDDLPAIREAVERSVAGSLQRLGVERLALLQIHNAITRQAGSLPTSLSPAHVLAPGGLLEAMHDVQRRGLVEHLGLTGLGETAALDEVISSGPLATVQVPYHLLNPSAGCLVAGDFPEADYGNLIAACQARGMGVFVIRVLAGGALAGQPPSPHTLKTPYFPLDLYQRDCRRAEHLAAMLPASLPRDEAAIRFVLGHPGVTSAIVGWATPEQVERAVAHAAAGPLDATLWARLNEASRSAFSGEW
jgi:aryl-alcohol dehydrogenase-like predicted oxidoreductase